MSICILYLGVLTLGFIIVYYMHLGSQRILSAQLCCVCELVCMPLYVLTAPPGCKSCCPAKEVERFIVQGQAHESGKGVGRRINL